MRPNSANSAENSQPPFGADPIAAFTAASVHLQESLLHERERLKKTEEQLRDSRRRLAETLAEDRQQIQELSGQVAALRASNGQYREHCRELEEKLKAGQAQNSAVAEELKRYKSAWAEVIQREREAKQALVEGAEAERKLEHFQRQVDQLSQVLAEEQQKRERAERFSETYQAELKHALVRIHSAEGKFAELSKEHQALAAAKRNFQEEVGKVEVTIREKAAWEIQRERERVRIEQERLRSELDRARLELDRALVEERQRVRAETQASVLGEVESKITEERAALADAVSRVQRLNAELEAARNQLRTLRARRMQERAGVAKRLSSRRKQIKAQLNQVKNEHRDDVRRRAEGEKERLAVRSIEAEGRLRSQAEKHGIELQQLQEELELSAGKLAAYEEALRREVSRSDGLEIGLAGAREAFQRELCRLTLELSELRAVEPVRHLLVIKRGEVESLKARAARKPAAAFGPAIELASQQLTALEAASQEVQARYEAMEARIRTGVLEAPLLALAAEAGPGDSTEK